MAIIYVDPSLGSNGSGTFASPRNVVPTSVSYGDKVLFKEGTTLTGGWAVPAPSGVGADGNRLTIGTYDARSGQQIVDTSFVRMATIQGTTSVDAIFLNGVTRSYVTVEGLNLTTFPNYPNAGVRALNASYISVRYCRIHAGNYTTGIGYGIRITVATGNAAACSNWEIVGNRIEHTTGNDGILCAWGANSGEYVTDITITDNVIKGIVNNVGAGGACNGIRIKGLATSYTADEAGLKAKGVRVLRNKTYSCPGYGIKVEGVQSGGSFDNLVSLNEVYNNGDGAADGHAIHVSGCDDITVSYNLVDTTTAWANQTTGTQVGIFIDKPGNETAYDDDGSTNVVVTGNRIYRANLGGASLNTELGGAGIVVFLSQSIKIVGNVCDSCANGIVVIGWYGSGTKSQNVEIYNNTVVNSARTNYYICKGADAVTLKNNISVGAERGYYIENVGTAYGVTNYAESNNIVDGASAYSWAGGNEPTQTTPSISQRTPLTSNLAVMPELGTDYKPRRPRLHNGGETITGSDLYGNTFPGSPSFGAIQCVGVFPRGMLTDYESVGDKESFIRGRGRRR